MKSVTLSLLLFCPGLALALGRRENFCCKDKKTWIVSPKVGSGTVYCIIFRISYCQQIKLIVNHLTQVCDGVEDCPRTEIGGGGEDEEGCNQEEGITNK